MAASGTANRAGERAVLVPWWLRGPSLFFTVFWFVVRDFIRSSWLYVNIAVILLVHLFMLGGDPKRGPYFGAAYMVMLALSSVNTLVIFSRANAAHTYSILARPVTRTTYIMASMLAAWCVSILSYAVFSALFFLRYGPPLHTPAPDWLALQPYLGASIPVLVAITFMMSLMTLLAAFVSPFWVRLVVLGLITLLVMSFDPRTFPLPFMRGIIERIPPVLAPIAGALRFATESPPDSLARASLIILIAYTLTLQAFILWLSTRREVVLD